MMTLPSGLKIGICGFIVPNIFVKTMRKIYLKLAKSTQYKHSARVIEKIVKRSMKVPTIDQGL